MTNIPGEGGEPAAPQETLTLEGLRGQLELQATKYRTIKEFSERHKLEMGVSYTDVASDEAQEAIYADWSSSENIVTSASLLDDEPDIPPALKAVLEKSHADLLAEAAMGLWDTENFSLALDFNTILGVDPSESLEDEAPQPATSNPPRLYVYLDDTDGQQFYRVTSFGTDRDAEHASYVNIINPNHPDFDVATPPATSLKEGNFMVPLFNTEKELAVQLLTGEELAALVAADPAELAALAASSETDSSVTE